MRKLFTIFLLSISYSVFSAPTIGGPTLSGSGKGTVTPAQLALALTNNDARTVILSNVQLGHTNGGSVNTTNLTQYIVNPVDGSGVTGTRFGSGYIWNTLTGNPLYGLSGNSVIAYTNFLAKGASNHFTGDMGVGGKYYGDGGGLTNLPPTTNTASYFGSTEDHDILLSTAGGTKLLTYDAGWDALIFGRGARGEGSGLTNLDGQNLQSGTISNAQIAAATINSNRLDAATIALLGGGGGGGSQTPWLQNVSAAGFALSNVFTIEGQNLTGDSGLVYLKSHSGNSQIVLTNEGGIRYGEGGEHHFIGPLVLDAGISAVNLTLSGALSASSANVTTGYFTNVTFTTNWDAALATNLPIAAIVSPSWIITNGATPTFVSPVLGTIASGNGAALTALTAANITAGGTLPRLTAAQRDYTTNAAVIAPDFSKGYTLWSTNAAFTFGLPTGIDSNLAQTTVVIVTNSTAAAVLISPPAAVKTQGTWYCTNVTTFTFFQYGNKFTNAVALPLY